ncbi:MAG: biopolymer transporter ExbB [Moraxellaceae bacterium]|nr:MAG: biopolymer transporter ExbB [Moraxellaceae bacterium]
MWFETAVTAIEDFMSAGGDVLWLIAILMLLLWGFIFERVIFFHFSLQKEIDVVLKAWHLRSERASWSAHQIRQGIISRMNLKIQAHLPMIKALTALCPLMGLLGTVTGMIEVFNVMAVTGGGDARSMASGVSKATIPCMAGMVAALAGVFAGAYVSNVADRESELLEDHLTVDA